VLVIDKPAGLAVQGGSGLSTSVDDLLMLRSTPRSGRGSSIVSIGTPAASSRWRNERAAKHLTEAFRHKDAQDYWAIVVGVPMRAGRIVRRCRKLVARAPNASMSTGAVTEFAIEKAGKKAAWLALCR
jgi:23S rRNA pseudouridine955/2504/2580 synthase